MARFLGASALPALVVIVGCSLQTEAPEVTARRRLAGDIERSSEGLLKVFATPNGSSPSLSIVLTRQAPAFMDAAEKSGLLLKLRAAGYREVTITTQVGIEPAMGQTIRL